jgi:hypothetical protein
VGRKEGREGGRKGGREEGKEGGNPSICSVRSGLFNQAGMCQLNVACRKWELSQRKWQTYILILAKMWVITPSVREMMKCEPKKMSS